MDRGNQTYPLMQTQEEFCHCEERSDETVRLRAHGRRAISENSEIATPFGFAMTVHLVQLHEKQ